MQTFIRGSFFVIVTGMLIGYVSGADPKSAAPPALPADKDPKTDKPAAAKDCVMKSGETAVLKLTPPAGSKWEAADGSLKIDAPKYYVVVWLVSGAKTVDEATGKASIQIVSEFKNFKPTETTDLTIAGSPAKEIIGAGNEADDNDAGKAAVIVFKVGDHVFVGCNHGENLTDDGRQGLEALVKTAQKP